MSRCRRALRRIDELWPLLEQAMLPGAPGEDTTTSHFPPGLEEVAAIKAEYAERSLPRTKAPTYLAESEPPADLDVLIAVGRVRLLLATAHDHLLTMAKLPRACRRCGHDATKHREALRTESGALKGRPCCRCPGLALRYVYPADPSWAAVLTSTGEPGAAAIEPALMSARRTVEMTVDSHPTGKLILVPCPWCRGVNEAMPGGSYTLRVFTPGAAPDTYVVCLNLSCKPPEEACGTRRHGRPMWAFHELNWLADRLDDAVRDREQAGDAT